MSVATTTAPVESANLTAPRTERPATTGAGFGVTSIESARRTVLQFFRTPQVLIMGTVQGAMFLFMFRYVFGGAISTGGAVSYVNFLVPGFLVTVILWTGMGAASGVAEDSASGVYDRMRSLPVPRSAIMVGRSIADTSLVAWGVLTTAIIGFAVGFRPAGSVLHVLAGFGLIIVAAAAFSWIFIVLGLVSGNAQAAHAEAQGLPQNPDQPEHAKRHGRQRQADRDLVDAITTTIFGCANGCEIRSLDQTFSRGHERAPSFFCRRLSSSLEQASTMNVMKNSARPR